MTALPRHRPARPVDPPHLPEPSGRLVTAGLFPTEARQPQAHILRELAAVLRTADERGALSVHDLRLATLAAERHVRALVALTLAVLHEAGYAPETLTLWADALDTHHARGRRR